MGQEIGGAHFRRQDFRDYARRLKAETELLIACDAEGGFSARHGVVGFELEAWLVDGQGLPLPENEALLARLDSELVGPELSRFNIELNSTPRLLEGDALRCMATELAATWTLCREAARPLGAELVMIGILPTVTDEQLNLNNMSRSARYRALNEQVMRARRGRPLHLDIEGEEHLATTHRDVMLEAATTSFQLHLQVAASRAVDYYNAAVVASAPLIAMSTNSPLLFGRNLWRETRIPLFEQAVAVGGYDGAAFGPVRRVTFGSDYVRSSLMELFRENLEHYPPLLPVRLEEAAGRFPHLRLHNGTIWRWNRPLIGFDPDGRPHLRIEQRVMPAGPGIPDTIANAAFCLGLVRALAGSEPRAVASFVEARENFHAAAKHGLKAVVSWNGSRCPLHDLMRRRLLPMARAGLAAFGCATADIDEYLGIVAARTAANRTGADWQLGWLARHGADFRGLVAAYRARQESGLPVHEWSI